ncbi:MAG TPA: GtrA family protein [Puia sp.]|nr:GtrA family protein [Puia sp.]
MITFTKAQLTSLLATGVDFLVTLLLLRWAGLPPAAASGRVTFYGATGTLCGGFTHFMISRNWVFNAQEKKWTAQLNRYILVWIGNLALNASGLYLLNRYAGLDPMPAKIITATMVAVFYNYTLQKKFVFKG